MTCKYLRLLAVSALDMNVVRLDVVEEIFVSPFFVITRADRDLSPIASHVIQETFRNI